MLSVDCHPSGTVFATGSSDAKVKLWDLQTRTCSQTVTDHSDQVLHTAPHLQYSYCPCHTNVVDCLGLVLHEMSWLRILLVLMQVWSVAWQHEGRRLASASDDKSIGFYTYL